MTDRPKPAKEAFPGISPERRAELDALARRDSGSLPAAPSADSSGGKLLAPEDERGSIFSVFSAANRKGPWEPPAELNVFAAFGGVDLDFREADLLEGVSEVKVFAMFGGVDIIVPHDIDVETKGFGLFGGFSHHTQRADEADAPVLRVTGLALFGGVGVKAKARKRRWKRGGKR